MADARAAEVTLAAAQVAVILYVQVHLRCARKLMDALKGTRLRKSSQT